jgi:predicted protein tyrosine phosphatase
VKILFVCSKNQWRSPTAENLFSSYPGISVRSAGVSPKARIKVNEQMIEWADLIFVMEKRHRQILEERFDNRHKEKMIVLDIADDYQYMDNELIEILKLSVGPYLPPTV